MSRIHPVTLPKWGLEMSEGTVTAWHVSEGGAVEPGAEIVDIETDKIVNALDLPVGGVLRRILVAPGETVAVGTLIGVLADPAVPEADIDRFVAEYRPVDASFEPAGSPAAGPPAAAPEAAPEAAPAPAPAPAQASAAAPKATPLARRVAEGLGVDLATVAGDGGRIRRADVERATRSGSEGPPHASPVALKFAEEIGLSLAGLTGTGRKGRVSLADAQAAAQAHGLWRPPASRPASAPQPAEDPAHVPFTPMRRTIARALSASKATVPHFYTAMDCEVDRLLALRAEFNEGRESSATLNDFLMKAAALAARQVPEVNAHVDEAGTRPFGAVHLGLAVAIHGGLMTPVLRDADSRSLTDLSVEAARLAGRARDRALTAEEVSGATLTVSNLGMFGVRSFDAIVAAPQAGILALGGIRREAREGEGGAVRFASVLTATLSADHRAVDGATAARFLAAFRDAVERPLRLLG